MIGSANALLAKRAKQLNWPAYDHHIDIWLPAAADRLEPCRQGLKIAPSRPNDTPWGRVPYTISCQDPSWRLRGRAEVQVWLNIWVARHDLARDRAIQRNDLLQQRLDISALHSSFTTEITQLLGHRPRRGIRAGQPVSPGLLAAEELVKKGDQVIIKARADGLLASMTGTALDDGARQQEIKVRNHSSGKVISAWVVGRGIVETRF